MVEAFSRPLLHSSLFHIPSAHCHKRGEHEDAKLEFAGLESGMSQKKDGSGEHAVFLRKADFVAYEISLATAVPAGDHPSECRFSGASARPVTGAVLFLQ